MLKVKAIDFINGVLDPIGIVLGLIIAIPVLWTWYEIIWGEERKKKRRYKDLLHQHKALHPSILVVTNKDGVVGQINTFRSESEELKNIPPDRVLVLEISKNVLTGDDMPTIVKSIRQKADKVREAGTDVLHCFLACPVTVAALVGAEFKNDCRVILYQYSTGSTGYENWGFLQYPYDL